MAAGPYMNSRSPNPSCCSDPRVLCPKCARLALDMDASELFEWGAEVQNTAGFFRYSSEPRPVTQNAASDAADVRAMCGQYGTETAEQHLGLLPEIVPDGVIVGGEPGDELLVTRIDYAAIVHNRRVAARSKTAPPAERATENSADDHDDDVRSMTAVYGR